jgi:hypothetical protein
VDAHALERTGVRRFLCECKVAPAQLGVALRRARELVASTGGALLRVEVAAPSSVRVTAAPSRAPDVAAGREASSRGELALASLAAAS